MSLNDWLSNTGTETVLSITEAQELCDYLEETLGPDQYQLSGNQVAVELVSVKHDKKHVIEGIRVIAKDTNHFTTEHKVSLLKGLALRLANIAMLIDEDKI